MPFHFWHTSPVSAFYIFGVLKKGGMDETFTWFSLSVAHACMGENNHLECKKDEDLNALKTV